MAKKNLCFELEYIQAVIERLEGGSSSAHSSIQP